MKTKTVWYDATLNEIYLQWIEYMYAMETQFSSPDALLLDPRYVKKGIKEGWLVKIGKL